jgi:hypothetical protein
MVTSISFTHFTEMIARRSKLEAIMYTSADRQGSTVLLGTNIKLLLGMNEAKNQMEKENQYVYYCI